MGYDPIRMSDEPPAELKCERCGKPCLHWQRFCGAACSVRHEMGIPAEISALPELGWDGKPVKTNE